MSLVRKISALTAARYGVNIQEVSPPAQVQGVGTSIIGVVAATPWGPEAIVTQVSGAGLFDTFCPLEFGVEDDYAAMKAFLNKPFPSVANVARVAVTGAAASTETFQGAGAVDSVVATARYKGVAGDLISIEWVENDDDSAHRDAIVSITPTGATEATYSKRHLNVAVDGTPIVVTSPTKAEEPFVSFAIAAGAPAVVPTVAAAAPLTSGADGTAVAGDFTAAIDLFADANVEWSVGFVAEPPEALIDDINTGIKSFLDTNDVGFWVYATPALHPQATALTDVAALRHDRSLYPWPKVQTINGFDPNRDLTTVQGNSFAAVAIASVDPENSPGGAGGNRYLAGIKALEEGQTATDAELEILSEAGITPFVVTRRLEPPVIMRRAVTTSITSVDSRKVFVRRMKDYVNDSIAELLALYVERPLDLDLARQLLGPVTGPEIAAVRAFLAGLAGENEAEGRIKSYTLDEFSGNLQANIDAGQWILDLRYRLFSMQEEVILRVQAGTTVEIEEAA